MAFDLNRLTITCRLFRDPVLRTTQSGAFLAELGVVTSNRRRLPDGSYEDLPVFLTATVWESNARLAERYLHSGDRVLLDGRLRHDRWEDASGEKRGRHTMAVERMLFLDTGTRRKSQPEETGQEGPESAQGDERTLDGAEQQPEPVPF